MRQQCKAAQATMDVLEVLNSAALREPTDLVRHCQSACTATPLFRGEGMEDKFRCGTPPRGPGHLWHWAFSNHR